MREEKLNFSLILRIGISLIPILFGMPIVAVIWCAYSIAMSFLACGPLTSFVSSLCAVCISMFFCSSYGEEAKLDGLYLGIEAVLCAAGCIYSITRHRSFYVGVWCSSLGFLIPSVMSLKQAAANAGLSIAEFLTDIPFEMIKSQIEAMPGQSNVMVEFSAMESILSSLNKVIVALIPSILVIGSIMVGYIVMWCVNSRLRIFSIGIKHSFSKIKVSRSLVLIMFASFAISVIVPLERIEHIFLNFFVILAGICFFAGMSFVEYYLRRFVRNPFVRIIIHLLILSASAVISFLPVIYALIAILDAFFDFRGLRREVDETEKQKE